MGKGGGGQSTPYEAPNDLSSRQKVSLIDLISEGPIEGPEEINNVVNDLSCVYLDDTPVIDGSGNSTVNGMTAQWRAGTLEQPALYGFTSSANEVPVGIEVKYNVPVTRTITAPYIDRLRLIFGTQALVESKDNGDRVPTSVQLEIQIQRGGVWSTEKLVTITGKRSNSPYLMAVVLDNLPPTPFSVRMIRVTADSTTDQIQNNTVWSSYSELTDINQIYPGSAVAGLTFESEQFGNKFPRRNYLIKGRIIQVPENYNPDIRAYSGIWDGTFKPAWSDNPAWILWDLLTHPRYGMGRRLKIAEVDKFALYMIGQYCDHEVDNGFGGKEPRVRCNAYITDLRKAYDVISELCASMRIMPVWNGQTLTFIQDRPSDSVWPYTNANVVDGVFDYSFSPEKARHNVIEVRFIDPDNGWKTSVEQVSDDASLAKPGNGRNVLRVDAFGCTSRGQAHRHGLWILTTEKLEIQTVEFRIGAEGLRHSPGDIFEIADNDWVDTQIGGRILSVDTENKVLLLDRNVEKPVKGNAHVIVTDGSGMPKTIKVTGYPATNQIILDVMPEGIPQHSAWTLSLPSLRRRLFRAITLADNGDGTFSVTAVQHIPEKETIVDKGAAFEPKPDTPLGGFIPSVENLTVEVTSDNEAWQAESAWNSPYALRGVEYQLKLTIGDRVAGTAVTKESFYRFSGMPQGNYVLTVVPQNDRGQKGEPASAAFSVNPPPPPSYIDVEPGYFSIGVIPRSGGQNSLRLQYEFWFSEKQIADIRDVESATAYLGNGTMWIVQGRNMKAGHRYFVYIRSVNVVGKSTFVEASGIPESNAGEILDVVQKELEDSAIIKDLQSQADDNFEAIINNANNAYGQWNYWQRENGAMKAEIIEVRNYTVTATTALAEKIDAVKVTAEDSFAMAENAIRAKWDMESGQASVIHDMKVRINYQGTDYSAGMVIGAELKNGQVTTLIGFSAQQFAFYNPVNKSMDLFMYMKDGQLFVKEAFISEAWIKSLIVTDKIQSDNYEQGKQGFLIDAKTGKTEINGSATDGGRMEFKNDQLRVWDEKGRLRVEIGRLTG